ncbi:MAG: hypothetical protein WAX23_11635 [Methanosarcina sp.]
MATNYFVEIAVELTVLFIGITFLVGLIQEYVSDETIKKALGGRHRFIGVSLEQDLVPSPLSAPVQPYRFSWGC